MKNHEGWWVTLPKTNMTNWNIQMFQSDSYIFIHGGISIVMFFLEGYPEVSASSKRRELPSLSKDHQKREFSPVVLPGNLPGRNFGSMVNRSMG